MNQTRMSVMFVILSVAVLSIMGTQSTAAETAGTSWMSYSAQASTLALTPEIQSHAGLPAKPEVTASPGDGQILFTWEVPDEGGSPITHYVIDMWLADDSGYVRLGVIREQVRDVEIACSNVLFDCLPLDQNPTTSNDDYMNEDPDVIALTVTRLINGEEYKFRIYAVSALGSGTIEYIDAVTPRATPGAVSDLTVESGNGYIKIEWDKPTDNGGSKVTEYNVYIYSDDTLVDSTTVYAFDYRRTTFKNLTNGEEYTLVIGAVNTAGEGALTTVSNIIPAHIPKIPKNFAAAITNEGIALRWSPADDNGSSLTSYQIFGRIGSVNPFAEIATLPPDMTSFTYEYVVDGASYEFIIRATNDIGAGKYSEPVTITAVTPPKAPTNFKYDIISDGFTLTWDAPVGGSPVIGYVINVTISEYGSTIVRNYPAPVSFTSLSINGNLDADHTFTIYALSSIGPGEMSDTLTYIAN